MELRDKLIRNKDTGSTLVRYQKSFFHAIDGIKYVICNEHNLVIIILAMLVTTIMGFAFKVSLLEWLFIITSFALVLGCELLNSAIEALVDLTTSNINPLAKIAKDCGAGATLVFSFMAFVGALIIFIPKLF